MTGSRGVFDTKIAFVSANSGQKEIYICDFDGSNPTVFTDHKNISLSPAWSSDGRFIAYTSYVRNKPDLFIKNVKDKLVYTVDKEGTNISPGWVPGRPELAASLSFSGDPEI